MYNANTYRHLHSLQNTTHLPDIIPQRISTNMPSPYPLYPECSSRPPKGMSAPDKPSAASVVGCPSLSMAHPSGIGFSLRLSTSILWIFQRRYNILNPRQNTNIPNTLSFNTGPVDHLDCMVMNNRETWENKVIFNEGLCEIKMVDVNVDLCCIILGTLSPTLYTYSEPSTVPVHYFLNNPEVCYTVMIQAYPPINTHCWKTHFANSHDTGSHVQHKIISILGWSGHSNRVGTQGCLLKNMRD